MKIRAILRKKGEKKCGMQEHRDNTSCRARLTMHETEMVDKFNNS